MRAAASIYFGSSAPGSAIEKLVIIGSTCLNSVARTNADNSTRTDADERTTTASSRISRMEQIPRICSVALTTTNATSPDDMIFVNDLGKLFAPEP